MLAQATATATATTTAAAQSSDGGTDLTSVTVGAIIAAVALMLGHSLTHLYATRRERRADLAATLDKTLAAFVAGDRIGKAFIFTVSREHERLAMGHARAQAQAAIRDAADTMEEHEVAIRSAVLSLRIRLRPDAPVAAAFEHASLLYSDSYTPLTPLLHGQAHDPDAVLEAAHEAHERYRDALDEAINTARRELAPRRA